MTHRFKVFAGDVRSRSDGQIHYVNATQLARLYRVDPAECFMVSGHPLEIVPDDLIPLFPRDDGRYVESLHERKMADFKEYVRARKLYDHHTSGSSPRRGKARRDAADRQARSIAWHEKHWPDFPAAYKRLDP